MHLNRGIPQILAYGRPLANWPLLDFFTRQLIVFALCACSARFNHLPTFGFSALGLTTRKRSGQDASVA